MSRKLKVEAPVHSGSGTYGCEHSRAIMSKKRRYICRKCGISLYRDRMDYLAYRPGEIGGAVSTSDRPKFIERRRPLTWKEERRNGINCVYFPCVRCGSVMTTMASDIGLDGVIFSWSDDGKIGHPCVVCSECGVHFWIYFDGFEG